MFAMRTKRINVRYNNDTSIYGQVTVSSIQVGNSRCSRSALMNNSLGLRERYTLFNKCSNFAMMGLGPLAVGALRR